MVTLPAAAYSHYLAGKLALYQDDSTTAANELAAAAAAAPTQPMIAVEQARALVRAKRVDEARRVLAATRAAWPEHAQVWLASGELLEKTLPVEAMPAYKRAIELEPGDERAYLGLARAELAIDHPRRAEAVLRELVIHVPGSVEGRYRLAQRLLARNARNDAIPQLKLVLERDPDHLDARLDLARALRRNGDMTGAVAQTRSAFDRAGQPMDIAEELFWLLCEADDVQGAIDLLTLLDDDRSDAEALATVARLNIGLGRVDVADAIAHRLDTMREDLAALVRVQVALARRDRNAADTAAAVIHDDRIARTARLQRGFAALDAHDVEGARALLVTPDLSTTAAGVFIDARIEEALHHRTAAIGLLEQLVRRYPDEVGALNLLGYLLADSNTRLPEAERVLRRARELAPGDPAVLDSWGWLLVAEGKPRDAVRVLEQAVRLAPLEPEILAHRDAARRAAHDTMRP
jgi:predicted Zn-dependent protease